MVRLFYILVISFLANYSFSQSGLKVESISNSQDDIFNFTSTSNKIFPQKNTTQVSAPIDLKSFLLNDHGKALGYSILHNNNSNKELAFFCRIEAEIEQSSKLPVKFRLGEVQQVDQKEGKWKQFNLEN